MFVANTLCISGKISLLMLCDAASWRAPSPHYRPAHLACPESHYVRCDQRSRGGGWPKNDSIYSQHIGQHAEAPAAAKVVDCAALRPGRAPPRGGHQGSFARQKLVGLAPVAPLPQCRHRRPAIACANSQRAPIWDRQRATMLEEGHRT